jgi:Icc-related predicted phosphoesterase
VAGERTAPWGGIDLHRAHRRHPSGLLMAGIEGSLRYNFGPYQYTDEEMWWFVLMLAPGLLLNKLRYGRFLDVFVTHSPPWHIHDADDRAHRGSKAFRWLLQVFKPAFHLHGHIHIYRRDTITETWFDQTRVINVFGYREITFNARDLVLGGAIRTSVTGQGKE